MTALPFRKLEPRLARNMARCKDCSDVIESKVRNDFQTCACGKIAIDGGLTVKLRYGDLRALEELCEFEEGGG